MGEPGEHWLSAMSRTERRAHMIVASAKTVLLLPFWLQCLLLLFLAWLLQLGLPVPCWTEEVRVETLVLFLILEGKLSTFHCWACLLWACLCGLYCAEVCSLYTWLESMKGLCIFVNYFFCIYGNDHVTSNFPSINTVYRIGWFAYVGPPLHPRDKSLLIMMYVTYNVPLNSVC